MVYPERATNYLRQILAYLPVKKFNYLLQKISKTSNE